MFTNIIRDDQEDVKRATGWTWLFSLQLWQDSATSSSNAAGETTIHEFASFGLTFS